MAPFLIALLVLGGGTSLAAKSALPGSPLYGVKTGFNENLRASFNVTDEQKAHWDAVLEGRRLSEAEQLSLKGKLDASTEADLKARFEKSAQDYSKRMETIASKNEGSADSVETASNLEGTLRAHADIMSGMSASSNEGSAQMADLMSSVGAQISAVSSSRAMLESKFSADTKVATKSAAESRRAGAQSSIDQALAYAKTMNETGSANTVLAANANIDLANDVFVKGTAAYDSGDYATAFLRFQDAARIAGQTHTTLTLGKSLNLGTSQSAGTAHTGNGQIQGDTTATGSASVNGSSASDGNNSSSGSSSGANAGGGIKVNVGL